MFSSKFFLIGAGAIYGVLITLIAIFFSKGVLNYLNNYADRKNGMYSIKLLAVLLTIIVWICIIALFWKISWSFPIDDDLWSYFSGLHGISIWLTLVIYFRIKRSKT
ncbi:hypothetical protein [Acinetobacter haemolyticus]|uniref:hypothetical protein n=1 Tax=Acinetobacter haemolyticus TaxID=29430 RepID=UPI0012FD6EA3|nr:hypothetical protein [Acinetobacter haemolyticus]